MVYFIAINGFKTYDKRINRDVLKLRSNWDLTVGEWHHDTRPIPLSAVISCLALFAPDWDSLTFFREGTQHEVVCEFTSKARVRSRQPSVARQRENESERGEEGEGMSAKQGSNRSKGLVMLRVSLYYVRGCIYQKRRKKKLFCKRTSYVPWYYQCYLDAVGVPPFEQKQFVLDVSHLL